MLSFKTADMTGRLFCLLVLVF